MIFSEQQKFARWFISISSLAIVSLFLWNSVLFFQQIKKEERHKMEIWGSAYAEIIKSDLSSKFSSIVIDIIAKNTTTPMVLYNVEEDSYETRNIAQGEIEDRAEIEKKVARFTSEYQPIEVTQNGALLTVLYYGNSDLLNRLKYFPAVIILIVVLFLGVMYYFYTIAKSNEQNKLWAGMAKETAHQIGTPLSSLVGWTEILKAENTDPEYIAEMKKDIDRLQTITERFSKIGSIPKLEKTDLIEATQDTYQYLKSRSSSLVHFSLSLPPEKIFVNLNPQLFSWTIENLVKNAIDALKGRGEINLKISRDPKTKYVSLLISDSGKGIPKKDFYHIFVPGHTTKKRGWGLGLSLAKRIVEEYHNGKIRVLKSELDKGTTFEIQLKVFDYNTSTKLDHCLS